ncbi:25826_t:CDS:1, partial [Gigaspora rosea]
MYKNEDDDNSMLIDISDTTSLVVSLSTTIVPSRNQITNYITPDHITKIEQKSLELEFARSIFK